MGGKIRYVEIDGEKLDIKHAAEKLGVNPFTVYHRIKYRGMGEMDALTKPLEKSGFKVNPNSIAQKAKQLGISDTALRYRLKNHTLEEATDPNFTPKRKTKNITVNGITKPLSEWIKLWGKTHQYYYHLRSKGKTDDEIFGPLI